MWGEWEGFARPLPEGKPELDRLSLLSEDFQRADCSRLQHFPHFPAMLQERFFCLPEKFPERLLASSKELLKRLHCLTRGRQSFPGSSPSLLPHLSHFSRFLHSHRLLLLVRKSPRYFFSYFLSEKRNRILNLHGILPYLRFRLSRRDFLQRIFQYGRRYCCKIPAENEIPYYFY